MLTEKLSLNVLTGSQILILDIIQIFAAIQKFEYTLNLLWLFFSFLSFFCCMKDVWEVSCIMEWATESLNLK